MVMWIVGLDCSVDDMKFRFNLEPPQSETDMYLLVHYQTFTKPGNRLGMEMVLTPK